MTQPERLSGVLGFAPLLGAGTQLTRLVPTAVGAAPRGFVLPAPAEGVKPPRSRCRPLLPSPLQSQYELGSPCLAPPVIQVTTFDYKIATSATRARLLTSNVWLQRTQNRYVCSLTDALCDLGGCQRLKSPFSTISRVQSDQRNS